MPQYNTVLILCFRFCVFFSFLALYGKNLHGDDHCCQIKVYIYKGEKIANPNADERGQPKTRQAHIQHTQNM